MPSLILKKQKGLDVKSLVLFAFFFFRI